MQSYGDFQQFVLFFAFFFSECLATKTISGQNPEIVAGFGQNNLKPPDFPQKTGKFKVWGERDDSLLPASELADEEDHARGGFADDIDESTIGVESGLGIDLWFW